MLLIFDCIFVFIGDVIPVFHLFWFLNNRRSCCCSRSNNRSWSIFAFTFQLRFISCHCNRWLNLLSLRRCLRSNHSLHLRNLLYWKWHLHLLLHHHLHLHLHWSHSSKELVHLSQDRTWMNNLIFKQCLIPFTFCHQSPNFFISVFRQSISFENRIWNFIFIFSFKVTSEFMFDMLNFLDVIHNFGWWDLFICSAWCWVYCVWAKSWNAIEKLRYFLNISNRRSICVRLRLSRCYKLTLLRLYKIKHLLQLLTILSNIDKMWYRLQLHWIKTSLFNFWLRRFNYIGGFFFFMKLFIHIENSSVLFYTLDQQIFIFYRVQLISCQLCPVAVLCLFISQSKIAIIGLIYQLFIFKNFV